MVHKARSEPHEHTWTHGMCVCIYCVISFFKTWVVLPVMVAPGPISNAKLRWGCSCFTGGFSKFYYFTHTHLPRYFVHVDMFTLTKCAQPNTPRKVISYNIKFFILMSAFPSLPATLLVRIFYRGVKKSEGKVMLSNSCFLVQRGCYCTGCVWIDLTSRRPLRIALVMR